MMIIIGNNERAKLNKNGVFATEERVEKGDFIPSCYYSGVKEFCKCMHKKKKIKNVWNTRNHNIELNESNEVIWKDMKIVYNGEGFGFNIQKKAKDKLKNDVFVANGCYSTVNEAMERLFEYHLEHLKSEINISELEHFLDVEYLKWVNATHLNVL